MANESGNKAVVLDERSNKPRDEDFAKDAKRVEERKNLVPEGALVGEAVARPKGIARSGDPVSGDDPAKKPLETAVGSGRPGAPTQEELSKGEAVVEIFERAGVIEQNYSVTL